MRHEVKIRGIRMVYDDLGRGEAIVFIHGQPFNRTMWRYQAEFFSKNYRLIIPDLRGYGETDAVPGTVLLDELALDLLHLLEGLEITQATFVGLSMGGQIAFELFRLRPELFSKLVLADTEARSETPEGYRHRLHLANQIESEGMDKFTEVRINKFLSPATFKDQPEVVAHLRKMMTTTSAAGSAAVQRGRAERRDHSSILSAIGCPTLIVVGDQDEFTPIESADYMHRRICGSELVVIPGAGHIPSMEQPEMFNQALYSFLKKSRE